MLKIWHFELISSWIADLHTLIRLSKNTQFVLVLWWTDILGKENFLGWPYCRLIDSSPISFLLWKSDVKLEVTTQYCSLWSCQVLMTVQFSLWSLSRHFTPTWMPARRSASRGVECASTAASPCGLCSYSVAMTTRTTTTRYSTNSNIMETSYRSALFYYRRRRLQRSLEKAPDNFKGLM